MGIRVDRATNEGIFEGERPVQRVGGGANWENETERVYGIGCHTLMASSSVSKLMETGSPNL